MFGKIAGFEFRYQLKNPVFWVAVIALRACSPMGSPRRPSFPIGGGNVHRNSPVALVRLQFIFSLYFMFVVTAFVANVVVRDDESGFGSIVRSTPISRFQYLIGRFAGACAAAALAWLVIPVALWFATLMPWLDPDTLGPTSLGGLCLWRPRLRAARTADHRVDLLRRRDAHAFDDVDLRLPRRLPDRLAGARSGRGGAPGIWLDRLCRAVRPGGVWRAPFAIGLRPSSTTCCRR